ncbi:AAA family ATPase [Cohnella sp. CIP 111063]|uniref:ATP-binding protein n=1 Tax=unclassified Cohnella TaxID=2636738 RepID=UPI000B8C3142|nr:MULTISPECIES: ATP-binding protein [unclassified Cohnella]OXS52204.1 AAA family ATPase [Cohnella sp. CIP 111063]PRX55536.1 replicative DNA helicase loader DnaI [Cohnella sp. SGD-V74]
MESLQEALRRLPFGPQSGRGRDIAAQVLADPLVVDLRERYPELDDQALRLNLNRLYQMTKEHRNCQACPGLEACPNDMQGHSTGISCESLNGRWQINDYKTPCSKWIAFEGQERIRRRVTSLYLDNSTLGQFYDEEEMIRLDANRAMAVDQLQEYADRAEESGLPTRGLYLQGNFGTGKTYLAGYLLHRLARKGYSGVIVYMPEFVEDAKALMFEPQKLKETITMMKEADLLVFDDIGAENLTPWVRDHVLGAILNHRMNRKPTFYTSNHDLEDLEKHFSFTHKEGEEMHKGQRLMDRIRSFVDVIHVRGRNHRGSGK